MGRSRSAMAKQLRETASHSMWRCFPCLKTTTSTLLCNAQEPPSVTSVCYYRREVEVLSFLGVSSLIHLERFHDCSTLHFIHERGDECDVGNTARGFLYSYLLGMSIKIREICGSRRCRATLLCIRPSRFMRESWLVRLRLHPTPKKRDPKSVSGVFQVRLLSWSCLLGTQFVS